MFTLVDDEDYEWLINRKWYARPSPTGNYYACTYNGRRMHREIMKSPQGMDVDHKNGKTLDNRKKNLSLKTRSQNLHGHRQDNHPMMGIKVRCGRYTASICVNRKRYSATFDTLKEAQSWRRSLKP